jgi:hypothetical protein
MPKSMTFASFGHFITSVIDKVTINPTPRFFSAFNTKNSLNMISIVRTGFNDVVVLDRIFMSNISERFIAYMEAVDVSTGLPTDALIDFYNELFKEQVKILGLEDAGNKTEAFDRCFEKYTFESMRDCFIYVANNIFSYISEEPVDVFLKVSNPYSNDVRFRDGFAFDHTKTIEQQIEENLSKRGAK